MLNETLGSFRVESIDSIGAMGVMFRAVHEATGKTAALKVLRGEVAQSGKAYFFWRFSP